MLRASSRSTRACSDLERCAAIAIKHIYDLLRCSPVYCAAALQLTHTIFVLLNPVRWGAKQATNTRFRYVGPTTSKITRSGMNERGGKATASIRSRLQTDCGESVEALRITIKPLRTFQQLSSQLESRGAGRHTLSRRYSHLGRSRINNNAIVCFVRLDTRELLSESKRSFRCRLPNEIFGLLSTFAN